MINSLVSVIMPAYNCQDTIMTAIDSILKQTYYNIELIICDDGSTDNTLDIIRSIKDQRVRVYENELNLGNLMTTNRLLGLCKGDYIAIQDADDYSAINRIECQLENIFSLNIDLIGSNVGIVLDDKVVSNISQPKNYEDILKFLNFEKGLHVIWGSGLFNRKIYDRIGGLDIKFDRIGAADIDWMLRAIDDYKFHNCNEILYYYRQHPNSFTKKNNSSDIYFLPKLFSEDLAYDLYNKNLKIINDERSLYFDNRLNFYRYKFTFNQEKLLSVYFNKIIFKQISLVEFILAILSSKTRVKKKISYMVRGIIFYSLGPNLVYFIKNRLR